MNAGYRATLNQLIDTSPEAVTTRLSLFVGKRFGEIRHDQTEAWMEQTKILQQTAATLIGRRSETANWTVFLEYAIPRRDRRIDAVLLAGGSVLVAEFKVGANRFDASSKWQTYDYALDIRDFHYASRNRPIFPVLVATSATNPLVEEADCRLGVTPLFCATSEAFADVAMDAAECSERLGCPKVDAEEWERSPYLPTLTIIEAAEKIFAGHQVREIAHAAADNLTATTAAIINLIRRAREDHKRILCVVTGVPGAGKTLTGLSAVHDPTLRNSTGPAAVFLSGNGPLIRVVRSALRLDAARNGTATRETKRQIETFIQSIHKFLESHGTQGTVPPENVVVFDEAQRAWSAEHMRLKAKSLSRRANAEFVDTGLSEPERLLASMERCSDWCVVVALVGGGQEINTGEAGLSEWGRAIGRREVPWEVVASPEALYGGASVAHHKLFEGNRPAHRIYEEASLHLRTNVRSLRSQIVSRWVNAVIAGDSSTARKNMMNADEFPVALTRDLNRARSWLKEHCTDRVGSGLYGLVASSGALRLRAHGIEVSSQFRSGISYEDWFLRDCTDVRSSQMLEVAATEFECQGLELDWVGVCWGDDMTWANGAWDLRRLRTISYRNGSYPGWTKVHGEDRQQFILNKYRVLLTRARKGFVVWVPPGSTVDSTRDPVRLDATAAFLIECGLPSIDEGHQVSPPISDV